MHAFPGHIACDAASRSEIVLPLHKNGEVIGVLDIDSPEVGRFSAEDEEGLREVVRILERIIKKLVKEEKIVRMNGKRNGYWKVL